LWGKAVVVHNTTYTYKPKNQYSDKMQEKGSGKPEESLEERLKNAKKVEKNKFWEHMDRGQHAIEAYYDFKAVDADMKERYNAAKRFVELGIVTPAQMDDILEGFDNADIELRKGDGFLAIPGDIPKPNFKWVKDRFKSHKALRNAVAYYVGEIISFSSGKEFIAQGRKSYYLSCGDLEIDGRDIIEEGDGLYHKVIREKIEKEPQVDWYTQGYSTGMELAPDSSEIVHMGKIHFTDLFAKIRTAHPIPEESLKEASTLPTIYIGADPRTGGDEEKYQECIFPSISLVKVDGDVLLKTPSEYESCGDGVGMPADEERLSLDETRFAIEDIFYNLK